MRQISFTGLRLAAVGVLLVSSASAAQTIDQQQASLWGQGLSPATWWLGQSFTPTANNVTGAGTYIYNAYGDAQTTTALTVQLWSALPSSVGATMLASATSPSLTFEPSSGGWSTPGAGGWVDLFWNAVGVTPGNTYFLMFNTSDSYRMNTTYAPDFYSGGHLWFTYDDTSSPANADWSNTNYNYLDMNFREYSSTTFSATPEPSAIALMATGLGVLGLGYRRRSKRA